MVASHVCTGRTGLPCRPGASRPVALVAHSGPSQAPPGTSTSASSGAGLCSASRRQQPVRPRIAAASSVSFSSMEVEGERAEQAAPGAVPGVIDAQWWTWKTQDGGSHRIRYTQAGNKGNIVICVHGFGGSADHWRRNLPDLAKDHRVFAIDLLGYGYSDKPDPLLAPPNSIYNFTNWGKQLVAFVEEVCGGDPVTIVCNSVGGLAGLEAAIARPDLVRGVQLLDISLRGLHVKRTNPVARPFVAAFQRLLKETDLGRSFFANVARPQTVRNIMMQAYGRKEAVTDELVDKILAPGLLPGAVDVFLDFISFSGGPLPEELLESCLVPVSILWGEEDPWEKVDEGRKMFSPYPCVTEFVSLPGIGHCPQDEAPEVVNPLIARFVDFASTGRKSAGSRKRAEMVEAAAAAAAARPVSFRGMV